MQGRGGTVWLGAGTHQEQRLVQGIEGQKDPLHSSLSCGGANRGSCVFPDRPDVVPEPVERSLPEQRPGRVQAKLLCSDRDVAQLGLGDQKHWDVRHEWV